MDAWIILVGMVIWIVGLPFWVGFMIDKVCAWWHWILVGYMILVWPMTLAVIAIAMAIFLACGFMADLGREVSDHVRL